MFDGVGDASCSQRHPSMPGGSADVIYSLKVTGKMHSDLIKTVRAEVSLSSSMTFHSQEGERALLQHSLTQTNLQLPTSAD